MSEDLPSVAQADVRLYLLGQTRAVGLIDSEPHDLDIQPKPLHLLAYLALQGKRRGEQGASLSTF